MAFVLKRKEKNKSKKASEPKSKDNKVLELTVKEGNRSFPITIYGTDSVENTVSFEAHGTRAGFRLTTHLSNTIERDVKLRECLAEVDTIDELTKGGRLNVFWDTNMDSPVLIGYVNGIRKKLGRLNNISNSVNLSLINYINETFALTEYKDAFHYMDKVRKELAMTTGSKVQTQVSRKEEKVSIANTETKQVSISSNKEKALELENKLLKDKIKDLEEEIRILKKEKSVEEVKETTEKVNTTVSLFNSFTPLERKRTEKEEAKEDSLDDLMSRYSDDDDDDDIYYEEEYYDE